MITLEPYQEAAVEWLRKRRRGLVVAPAGSGKCLGRGTPVLMANGDICPVEQLVSGDLLLGPDGKARRIESTCCGVEELFRIIPVKGEPYVVNRSHILSLRKSGVDGITTSKGSIRSGVVNISLDEWFTLPKSKKELKGWRSPLVEFVVEPSILPIPPYIMGLWLGDGTQKMGVFQISKPDQEIREAVHQWASSIGATVRAYMPIGKCPIWHVVTPRGQINPAIVLRKSAMIGDGDCKRHGIPKAYRTAPENARLELMAGLLDSDGHMERGGYDFISKDRKISEDIAFVSRSLGLAAYVTECIKGCQNGFTGTYYRVSISGDCSKIPCRIPRKRALPRLQKKSVLVTGITVESVGIGEYFGFELSGPDRLFLLGDFTVTHNTIVAAGALNAVIMAKARDRKVRVGWMANTQEQISQGEEALMAFPGTREADLKIACAASQMDWSDRDVLIVDEAAHSTAETWASQIQTCRGAVWGFTATPDGDDEERNAELARMFPERFVITRDQVKARLSKAKVILLSASDDCEELIDDEIKRLTPSRTRQAAWRAKAGPEWKKLAEFERSVIALNPDMRKAAEEKMAEIRAKMEERLNGEVKAMVVWESCVRIGIVQNEARTEAAIQAAKANLHRHVLVLVNQIEHGQYIAERIPGAVLCHSKMGAKARRAAMANFRADYVRCLVATSLCDEGLDLPMADTLVMVSGGRSRGKAEQRTGRVLRTWLGKDHGLIYDFTDQQHPTMERHARRRIDLYRQLGYEIETLAGGHGSGREGQPGGQRIQPPHETPAGAPD